MNPEQNAALQAVKEHHNVFLTGSPGTGKSYTLKEIIKFLKGTDTKFAVTASTGCSAVLINGQTIHSYIGLGISNTPIDKIVANIKSKQPKYKQLQELQTLIIDEISMLDNVTLERIANVLQKIKGNALPFGGIQVIVVGDFCQLSPVKGDYCFISPLWKELNFTTIYLTQLIRQKDDVQFQKILQYIRFGKCSQKTFNLLDSLKDTKFDNEVPTRLYSLNNDVDQINKYEFKRLYKMNTKKTIEEANIIQCTPIITDHLLDALALDSSQTFDVNKDVFRYHAYSTDKSIKPTDNQIDLIKGAYVMVTRNINFETGLINGTTGTVTSLTTTSVCITDINGNRHTVYYHKDVNENNKTYTKFMPIKLAYAMSIHKSQGATLDAIEVDGSSFIFAPGQLYTALSRARSLNSIRLMNLDKYSFICHKDVKEFYQTL